VTKTVLSLSNSHPTALPEAFQSDDVRYCPQLVEHFLREYTSEGDIVFDPFMGYGTTLMVAEKMERIGYGVEFDEQRCNYVKSQLKHPERALLGDSLRLSELEIPDFNFSITSPPYMGKHHTENPFTAYSTIGNGYEQYLNDLRKIYVQIGAKLKPNGHAIIEVSNLKHNDAETTPLAWDIAREVSTVLTFLGEIIIHWQPTYAYGYDHSYALVFSKSLAK
jgi:DNA modification methylase